MIIQNDVKRITFCDVGRLVKFQAHESTYILQSAHIILKPRQSRPYWANWPAGRPHLRVIFMPKYMENIIFFKEIDRSVLTIIQNDVKTIAFCELGRLVKFRVHDSTYILQ